MNLLESFEKQLKESADAQVDHSASFVWDDLSKAIQPKKKKRRFLFLLFLLIGILGAGLGSYLIIESNNESNNLSNEQNPSGSSSQSKFQSEKTPINKASGNNTMTSRSSVEINSSEAPELIVHAQASKGSHKFNQSLKKSIILNGSNNSSNTISAIDKNTTAIALAPNNENITGHAKNSDNTLSLNSDIPSGNDVRVNSKDTYSQSNELTLIRKLKDLDQLGSLAFALPLLSLESPDIRLPSGPKCPTFKKKNTSFFIELEGQIGFPLKYIKTGAEYSKIYELRKSSENPWYSWGIGLHAGVIYRNKLSLASGIEYSVLNERFDYSKTDIVDLIYHVDPNSGAVTGPFIVTKNIKNSGQIRHTIIDIPLLFGFETKSKHWDFGIQAGPFLNLKLASKGKIMTDIDQIEKIQDNDVYKEKLGLGLQGSLMISKKIDHKLSVYLKPGFKYYLNDWTTASYPINTTFNNATVSLGIRRVF